jgi:hypothetical protein
VNNAQDIAVVGSQEGEISAALIGAADIKAVISICHRFVIATRLIGIGSPTINIEDGFVGFGDQLGIVTEVKDLGSCCLGGDVLVKVGC